MYGKIGIRKVTVIYLFILALFLHWLLGTNGVIRNVSYLLLFGLIAIINCYRFSKGEVKLSSKEQVLLAVIAALIVLNLMIYGIDYHAAVNLFFFLLTLLCFEYIAWLAVEHRGVLDAFFKKRGCLLLNLYFWINILMIYIQSIIPGFLMTGYEPIYDNVTGMFGPGATHTITIFCVMLTCLNLEEISRSRNRFQKAAYLITTLVFMFITIQINDNTAFIIIFPICMFLYIIKKFRLSLVRILGIAIASIICALILYYASAGLREFVNGRFMSKIYSYIYLKNNGLTKTGFGDERIRAFEFTVLYGNSLKIGKGFVSNLDYVEGLENYDVFSKGTATYVGISDLSGISYLGGVWLYLLWCMLISILVIKIYRRTSKKITLGMIMKCFVLILIFTIYTTIFRSIQMAIIFSMYVYVLGYAKENEDDKLYRYHCNHTHI